MPMAIKITITPDIHEKCARIMKEVFGEIVLPQIATNSYVLICTPHQFGMFIARRAVLQLEDPRVYQNRIADLQVQILENYGEPSPIIDVRNSHGCRI